MEASTRFDLAKTSILNAEVKNEDDFNTFIKILQTKSELLVTDNGEIVQYSIPRLMWEKVKGSLGGLDHTQSGLLRDRTIKIIENADNKSWVNFENIKIIDSIAQRFDIILPYSFNQYRLIPIFLDDLENTHQFSDEQLKEWRKSLNSANKDSFLEDLFFQFCKSSNEELRRLAFTYLKSLGQGASLKWTRSVVLRIIKKAKVNQKFRKNEIDCLKTVILSIKDNPTIFNNFLNNLCDCKNSKLRKLAFLCLNLGADPKDPILLYNACGWMDDELVNELLEKGADPFKKSPEGYCTLDYVDFNRYCMKDLNVITHLLKTGIDITQTYNDFPLWISILRIATYPDFRGKYDSYIPMLTILVERLENLADLSQKRENAWSPLQIAAKNQNLDLFRVLVAKGAKIEGTSEELDMIQKVCEHIWSPFPLKKWDIDFVEKLMHQGLVPLIFHDKYFFILRFIKNQPQQVKDRFQITEEMISLLEKMEIEFRLNACKSRRHLVAIIDKIKGFKDTDLYKRFFLPDLKKYFDKQKQISDWIEKYEKDPSILRQILSDSTGFSLEETLSVMANQKKYSLIPDIIASYRFTEQPLLKSKLTFAFCLDQNWFGPQSSLQHLSGIKFDEAMSLFIMVLRSTLSLLPKSLAYQTLQKFIDKMVEPLCLALADESARKIPRFSVEWIVEQIPLMTPDKPIWIPCGCKGHATGLLVEKMENGKGKITLYNSGFGLRYHDRWKDKERYQLFYSIENIPLKNFLDKEIWHKFHELKTKSEDMYPIYQFLNNELGKGGTKLLPSKDKAFYSRSQFYGPCEAQNIMAMFEHQIKLLAPGSIEEKEAIWRILKSGLFLLIRTFHLGKDINEVNAVAEEKLKKFSIEREIRDIATREKFDTKFSQMLELLSFVGECEFAETLKEKKLDSIGEKFFVFKKGLKKIYLRYEENPKIFEPLEEVYNNLLSLALYLHRSREKNDQKVISFLNNLYKKKEKEELINQLNCFYSSRYRKLCINWVKNKVDESTSDEVLNPILLDFLKNNHLH